MQELPSGTEGCKVCICHAFCTGHTAGFEAILRPLPRTRSKFHLVRKMELRLASWLAFIKTLFIKVLLKNQAGQNVVITRPLWLFAASPRYGHILSGGKAIHSEEKFR